MKYVRKALKPKRKACLFVNVGGILDKLLRESNVMKSFKVVKYNTLEDKNTITEVVNRLNIKTVIVETTRIREYSDKIIRELIELRIKGISVYEAEEFYEIINKRVPIVRLETKKYIGDDIFSIRLRRRYRIAKRFFDLLFVFVVFPLVFPFMLIGGILTLLTSRGGVIFSQNRVGREGKIFKIYKIRSMVINKGGFTTKNDARITPVGKILRFTKIDELPQLYNILKGDMSVIGPRPEIPEYVEKYSEDVPFFKLRHMVKPGVSGWAQIHIPKATPEDSIKKLEYDLYYIKRYSFELDIKVLLRTLKIVLTLNSN